MIKVKMLITCKGSEDGFCVREFYKDEIYEISDNLAAYFFNEKLAIPEGPSPHGIYTVTFSDE